MRFLSYLREEYTATLPGKRQQYTVYKNPTPSEINHLHKDIISSFDDKIHSVRGLIDIQNKDIYILPGMADLHSNAYEKLKKHDTSISPNNLLSFLGYIDNHRIYGESLESFTGDVISKKIKLDWLKKYIANADSIDIQELSSFASFK